MALWEMVGAANRLVDAEQPWTLAKAAKAGDEAAGVRLRGVLGDLLEACRLVAFASAPYLPAAAPRAAEQLGIDVAVRARTATAARTCAPCSDVGCGARGRPDRRRRRRCSRAWRRRAAPDA